MHRSELVEVCGLLRAMSNVVSRRFGSLDYSGERVKFLVRYSEIVFNLRDCVADIAYLA